MADPIVIIGGGQAAASLAAKLRALGYGGALVMVSEEPVLPYQRPPLSKKYVAGELSVDRLLIRAPVWYDEQNIDVRLSTAAVELNPRDHVVTLADGSALRYDKLALATGSRPRCLPPEIGGDLAGVLTIRNLADADVLAPCLTPGRKLLVIGGGYIGLEAAAVAAAKGLDVTIVEIADRILQRVAAPLTSDYFRTLHGRHGVNVCEAAALQALTGRNGQLTGAQFKDGRSIEVDLAIVGIGVSPNDDLARQAGLGTDNGIVVDGLCRTSAPNVFAVGDCANFPWRGLRTRLESVQNAIDQAEHAAGAMLGTPEDYDPTPWFWSDQYDTKLQIAGLNRGYTGALLRPGKREHSQSVWYYRGDELLAVDAMNDALAYVFGKKAIDTRRNIPREVAGDPGSDLKAWLSR
jgi:3-phenylpropionate/trans-cinnamate dioxygenase ferredoxin reductase component